MKLNQRLTLSFVALLCVRCAPNLGDSAGTEDSVGATTEEVIASTATFDRLVYAPRESVHGIHRDSLVIDLNEPGPNVQAHGCATAANEHLREIRQIVKQSSVCRTLVPAGHMTCLAFAPSDIQLQGAGGQLELSPKLCAQGQYLCAGDDARLRTQLEALAQAPPDHCLRY